MRFMVEIGVRGIPSSTITAAASFDREWADMFQKEVESMYPGSVGSLKKAVFVVCTDFMTVPEKLTREDMIKLLEVTGGETIMEALVLASKKFIANGTK